MAFCDEQTIKDLEFPVILDWLEGFAKGNTAKNRITQLRPSSNFNLVDKELHEVNELLSIRNQGETFPLIDFDELLAELKLLPVKNAVLSQESFSKLVQASSLVNQLIYFFNKREDEFPLLTEITSAAYFTTEIIDAINKIFDRQGNILDNASPLLQEIRLRIKSLKIQINRNFDREIRKLSKENVLGDTKEAFVNDRRVLTVLSTHKRSISGHVVGSSKTGSLVFIEPQANLELNNELELQIEDERKEIYRILKELTKELAGHYELIAAYQSILTQFDFINAKTRLAIDLDCQLPGIVKETRIELIEAYHPILWKNNKDAKKKTFAQRIALDKTSRMLVISGPNAGGKSITLKTVGLLQIMLQSGLLIPVHGNSKCCFFQQVLSDIGDNQSIENELSTYSYRLKRMNHFLNVSNRRSLLLLDEFGTGSDPDLGGALAEVIFEKLYQTGGFAVITTHYGNIKLKADQLKNATNGCMLFDTETLEPLYRFAIGQPGSSFTFEVAQINGLPIELIQEAKTRIDGKKVKMDRLLSDLQKEKTYFERLNKDHQAAQQEAEKARLSYIQQREKFEQKLKSQSELVETNNKFLILGKKFQQFIDKYNTRSRKKTINAPLLEDVRKYIALEKSKIEAIEHDEKLKRQAKAKQPRKQKTFTEKDEFQRNKIKLGSTVKVISTKQTGTVEEINGTQITVLFGFMRMKVELEKLMWIK